MHGGCTFALLDCIENYMMISQLTTKLNFTVENRIKYSEKLFHISAAKKIIQNNIKTYSCIEECLQN